MPKNPLNQMVRLADYMTPQQAADFIGCTDRCVRQMLGRGDLGEDFLRLSPHSVLIPRKAVEKVAKHPAKTGRPRRRFAS